MKIKVKKINPSAKLPSYAHEGDAGMDIFSLNEVLIKPGQYLAIDTGISIEIPKGYVGLVWDKSGLAVNEGLKVIGGVIDCVYRGEIKIGIINLSDKDYSFKPGQKIAQMLVQKIENPSIVEVESLTETKRGFGGFGSTGK